jgi:hypothetical protein
MNDELRVWVDIQITHLENKYIKFLEQDKEQNNVEFDKGYHAGRLDAFCLMKELMD